MTVKTATPLSTSRAITASCTWNATTHKATVTLSAKSGYLIWYNTNSGTAVGSKQGVSTATIPNLYLKDKVYYKSYYGTYWGGVENIEVKDSTSPQPGFTMDGIYPGSHEIKFHGKAKDNESGLKSTRNLDFNK